MASLCHLTNVHHPLDQRIFYKEALSLAAAGHQVTLIAPGDPALCGERFGVHLQTIPAPRSAVDRLLNLTRLLRAALSVDADCYHFHDPELLPVGALLRLFGRHVVYDVHEHFPQVALVRPWVPDRLRRPLAWLVDASERAVARWLSGVVGVVEAQGRRFRHKPFAAVKNYPRLEWFGGSASTAEYELVHIGSLSAERGGLLLLDILGELRETHPDARLLSVGRFHGARVEAQFRETMAAYDLENHIELRTEPVPYEELGSWISRGRVGLIPGQVSAQNLAPFVPTKLFEYLACHLPVVASDLPSLRRFHASADWGFLVEPADARKHARAVAHLLDDPALARAKAAHGREMVEHCFNWAIEEQKLLAFYDQILPQKGDCR